MALFGKQLLELAQSHDSALDRCSVGDRFSAEVVSDCHVLTRLTFPGLVPFWEESERQRSKKKGESVPRSCRPPGRDPPLLGLLQCVPPLLLFQPPPSLLQLGEGVGSRIGGHSWILDERVRGLDLG